MDGLDPWMWVASVIFLVVYFIIGLIFSQVGPHGKGQLRDDPYFASHQICVCFYSCYLVWVGATAWFSAPDLASSRLRAEYFSTGGWYSLQLMFVLQVWDTVTTLSVKSLRSVEMLLHHIMAMVLCVSGFYSRSLTMYGAFGCGVLEVSTIPLALVTLWRPDRCGAMIQDSQGLQKLNTILRISFALIFLCVRGIYACLWVLPWCIYDVATCGRWDPVPRAVTVVALVFITYLQLKWSHLVIQQAAKMVSGKPKKDDDKPADDNKQGTITRRVSRRLSETLENIADPSAEPISAMKSEQQRKSLVCVK